jgi:hypothetical protein
MVTSYIQLGPSNRMFSALLTFCVLVALVHLSIQNFKLA